MRWEEGGGDGSGSNLPHISHVRHIPSADVVVKVTVILEQTTHAGDLGGVPVLDVAVVLDHGGGGFLAPQGHSLLD